MSGVFLLREQSLRAREEMNRLGRERTPFFFLFDYAGKEPLVSPLEDLHGLLFDFRGKTNAAWRADFPFLQLTDIRPPDFRTYLQAFQAVQAAECAGESYLVNLTFSSDIVLSHNLEEAFYAVRAPYRLYMPGRFLCFSPETFITITDGRISSHPMKGTIDSSVPNARQVLLADEKESAEHVTIVDLIRNDLGMVSHDVSVEDYRYVEEITARERSLLQVSSKISGTLRGDYHEYIGDIITSLLPAGSVTGAPKKRTLEIIASAESDQRGFYTGVAGIFDGRNLDSCVLIRLIEQTSSGLKYRSGGGVTVYSRAEEEYNELMEKIYVPLR